MVGFGISCSTHVDYSPFCIDDQCSEFSNIVVDDDGSNVFTTIQSAIDASSFGDTININAGSYSMSSTTIDKNLKLIGAGKGSNDTTDTILTISGTVIITSGGPSTTDRFTFQNMRITAPDTFSSNLFFVKSDDSFLFDNLTLIDIGGTPFLIWDLTPVPEGESNPSPPTIPTYGFPTESDIIISNSNFENNGCVGTGHPSDVKFFEFTGNAVVENVNVVKDSCDKAGNDNTFGLEFRGLGCNTGSSTLITSDSAVTSLKNVTISGTPNKHALLIQCYDDLSNFTMQSVDLTGSVGDKNAIYPTSLLVSHTGTTSFDLGDTKLTDMIISQSGNVDATNANFGTK